VDIILNEKMTIEEPVRRQIGTHCVASIAVDCVHLAVILEGMFAPDAITPSPTRSRSRYLLRLSRRRLSISFPPGCSPCIYLLGCLGVSNDDLREPDPTRTRSSGTSASEPRPSTRRADLYAYHTRGDNGGIWERLSAIAEVLRTFLAVRGPDHL
jgi:hypothetical protein